MFLHEILKVKQPEEFSLLCEEFHINESDLQKTPGEVGWFDTFYEMTHDSEGRYLDYTRGGRK